MTDSSNSNIKLFWDCSIALVTTSFAFIARAFLDNDPSLWPADLGLDTVNAQELFGAGIWPFAISIILFSLIIDRIGYRAAMIFSFVCYAIYAVLAACRFLKMRHALFPDSEILKSHCWVFRGFAFGPHGFAFEQKAC